MFMYETAKSSDVKTKTSIQMLKKLDSFIGAMTEFPQQQRAALQ